MISKWDIYNYIMNNEDLYEWDENSLTYAPLESVELEKLSVNLQQEVLNEIKIMQPAKVTCSKCGNDVSYGKQFDPVSNDMLLTVNPCKCED